MTIHKYFLDFEKEQSPKYIQIYRHIKNMIDSELIESGDKLPAIRKLSIFLKVNPTTVVKAYDLLEKERYIYKKDKSGNYVLPKKKIKEERIQSIRFDQANPKSGMFNIGNFKKAVELAISKEGDLLFDYQEGLGYEPLRKIICDYIATTNIFTTPERIQIISGAQQGINIITKSLLSYGDVVFMEEPSYPGAIEVFRENGIKIIGIPLLSDGIDIGVLQQKLKKIKPSLFYTMPNFQNPTGITYSKKKKLALLELAQKYDFLVVEDDYISDFSFMAQEHRSLRSYDQNHTTIYIKSFSKILMPGLRIGFMELPSQIRNVMGKIKYSMDISTSSFIQLSLFYYMKYFRWDEHLNQVGAAYQERFLYAKKILEKDFSDILSIREASGGINFFCSLPKEFSSIHFKEFLENQGIRILEGTLFYANPKSENDFRISIAHMEPKDIQHNLQLLKKQLYRFLNHPQNKIEFRSNK